MEGAPHNSSQAVLGGDMKYTVFLDQESDGGFVFSVPILPGCVSQGDTREEAMSHIKEAVDLYIEDLRRRR
jgi:predicted RNase H-like HicB family nuclease